GRGDGKLLGLWRGTVVAERGAAGIQEQITSAVAELLARAGLDRAELRGVGVGFGGPVDDGMRAVITSRQSDGWGGVPLAEWGGGGWVISWGGRRCWATTRTWRAWRRRRTARARAVRRSSTSRWARASAAG